MISNHFDNNGGGGYNGFEHMGQVSLSMNFFGERKGVHEMGHQFLNLPLEEQNKRPWSFQRAEENRGGKWREEEERERGMDFGGEGSEEVGEKRFGGHMKLCSRGHWRPHEDAKLKDLVAQFGPQNWNLIAEKLEGRSGKSCRLRWFNQLDPRINKRAFNEEEEERLLSAHKMYGNKWAMISRLFPGRTDNAVKNHWHVIMARRQRDHHHNNVYRRRKPPSSSSPLGISNGFVWSDCNGSSESTVSTIDESASTITDLSLTPTASRLPLVSLSRFSPVHQLHHHTCGLHMGSFGGEGKALKMANVGLDQFCNGDGGAVTKGMDVDQSSNSSDSNSEVSASESVGNERSKFVINVKKNKIPFIDFLGVGAT